ncbi:DUF3592 domain-containing protein [Hymenobacter profundi]|uniref:DUF3592 domain-containing protein n=1 Tax=Hymenobacter profundi TaxID=1982110 RepID=A0ABS6WYW7_9BACT|nr:DUF3592 domain-containing protein [Hymenobacter profundi]MBW3128231.1 DUF3592 domain-containing protein [Hymenobacter profundi]
MRGLRTTGVIINFIEDNSGDNSTFKPVVSFETQDHISVTATSWYGTEEAASFFHKGEKVDILYLPLKPQTILIVGYDTGGLLMQFFFFFLPALCILLLHFYNS